MLKWATGYLAASIVFVGCDFGWLTLTGNILYRPVLGPMLADRPRLAPAIAFYLLYQLGVAVFAVAPAAAERRPSRAAARGALFGLVAYATYDLTNQATLRNWSTRLTLADMAWGAVVTGLSAFAGCAAALAAGRKAGLA